jgi:glycosyltransferase involved in cell wall biosynthesis
MTSLSVVIPVYKGAESIGKLTADLALELPKLADSYEVIMVEDDGGDSSWQVIEQLAQTYSWVRGIKLMRNAGQHNALLCGIRAAQYELIVTMDDDGQHPTTEIHKLLEKLDEGYDVVYGAPMDKQHSGGRNFASWLMRFALSNAMGVDAARYISAFRAFRTPLRNAFDQYNSPFISIDVLLSWGTRKFDVVWVEHREREVGTSNYTFWKLLNYAMTMLTGFSVLPLRLASLLGFVMTVFGAILLFYVLVVRLILFGVEGYTETSGFTFLASMMALFIGAQMFTIGIIGEYLARMHFRLMNKPPYVIGEQTAEIDENIPEKTIT